MSNSDLIVGSQGCSINTLVPLILKSTQISLDPSKFAVGLNIQGAHVRRLKDAHLVNKITDTDRIREFLELWVGQKASEATLGKLLKILEEDCEATDVGKLIRGHFGIIV